MIGNHCGVSRILDLKAEGRRFDPGPGHQDLWSSAAVLVVLGAARDRVCPPKSAEIRRRSTVRLRGGRFSEDPHRTRPATLGADRKRLIRTVAARRGLRA
jgi:hypothetical protein